MTFTFFTTITFFTTFTIFTFLCDIYSQLLSPIHDVTLTCGFTVTGLWL
jgi:hypothetical protein